MYKIMRYADEFKNVDSKPVILGIDVEKMGMVSRKPYVNQLDQN